MPKDPKDYEKYRAYYKARESSPEGIKKRVVRQKARREAVKDGRLSGPSDPREVDHKKPLSKGGGNTKENTRIVSRTANRKKFDK
jgi:5-methylcytosine-specific restriction endonuclease McrA